MSDLKCEKAPDTNGLTAEHLLRAHPTLALILGLFWFQLIRVNLTKAGFSVPFRFLDSHNNISLCAILYALSKAVCEKFVANVA